MRIAGFVQCSLGSSMFSVALAMHGSKLSGFEAEHVAGMGLAPNIWRCCKVVGANACLLLLSHACGVYGLAILLYQQWDGRQVHSSTAALSSGWQQPPSLACSLLLLPAIVSRVLGSKWLHASIYIKVVLSRR
jgi:hypothetical protein